MNLKGSFKFSSCADWIQCGLCKLTKANISGLTKVINILSYQPNFFCECCDVQERMCFFFPGPAHFMSTYSALLTTCGLVVSCRGGGGGIILRPCLFSKAKTSVLIMLVKLDSLHSGLCICSTTDQGILKPSNGQLFPPTWNLSALHKT